MPLTRYFSLASLLVLLTSCVPQPQVTPHVTVTADKFSKDIEISGWGMYNNPEPKTIADHPINRVWRIRSYINKQTHAVRHQLYVAVFYLGNEKYFKYATDDNAKDLKVKTLYTRGKGCRSELCEVDEYLGIDISDKELRQRLTTGYQIKLSAKSGDELVLDITPQMLKLQFDAMDKYLQDHVDKGD